MPEKRSRQGCDECRKRRRKCDETKPICGPCTSFRRTCNYTLKLVWGARPQSRKPSTALSTRRGSPLTSGTEVSKSLRAVRAVQTPQTVRHESHSQNSLILSPSLTTAPPPRRGEAEEAAEIEEEAEEGLVSSPSTVPPCLPNGVLLSPPYRQLLDYFTKNILASLSVHPSIHQDLCQGLVPTMLQSPHLLSAGLALSAAGLASRGLSDVAGVGIMRVIEHLQSSGLALLRHALQRGSRDSILLATSLFWCLADVFAAGGRGGSVGAAAAAAAASATDLSETDASSPPPPSSSTPWRIHLQGIKALLGSLLSDDQAFETSVTGAGSLRAPMRHIYLLYLSLQTLPFVPLSGGGADTRHHPASDSPDSAVDHLPWPPPSTVQPALLQPALLEPPAAAVRSPLFSLPSLRSTAARETPRIDGFLGYSEELLDILQQIDHIANMSPPKREHALSGTDMDRDTSSDVFSTPHLSGPARAAADVLLGKAQGLVRRDEATSLPVTIAAPELSAASGREFVLCHKSFQQATLIHIYRRLFRLPSKAAPIQAAVAQIHRMAGQMTQGVPCHTWVAMSMPLFSVGCEACTPAQKAWSHASLDMLAASIGSMHVRVVRQALEDVWRLRAHRGDTDGRLCAGQLLDELNYNIVLF